MSDQPASTTPTAVGAMPGWRVVHFLRKPPWVSEEPIAAFLLDSDELGHPMVLDPQSRTFVVKLTTKDEYVIARPDEPAEKFVEDAKKSAREHRKWLEETRETRKQEKEAQQRRWEMHSKAKAFEATGRVAPPDHPARALFNEFSLLYRGPEEGASRIALGWFLVEHCTFGTGHEVARSAFEQRVGAFLDAYHLPRFESGALLRHLQHVEGIETFRHKNRVDGWKGLSLRADPPREAFRPEETDELALSVIVSVFIAHCVNKAEAWQPGGVSQPAMMAAFRAWRVGHQVRPFTARDLARLLSPAVMLCRKPVCESWALGEAGLARRRSAEGVVRPLGCSGTSQP